MSTLLFSLFVVVVFAGILADSPSPPDSPDNPPPARQARASGNPPKEPARTPRQVQCNPTCASGQKCFNEECITKQECSPACSYSRKCNHMNGQCFTPVQCNPSCVAPQYCNSLNGTCMIMHAVMYTGGQQQ